MRIGSLRRKACGDSGRERHRGWRGLSYVAFFASCSAPPPSIVSVIDTDVIGVDEWRDSVYDIREGDHDDWRAGGIKYVFGSLDCSGIVYLCPCPTGEQHLAHIHIQCERFTSVDSSPASATLANTRWDRHNLTVRSWTSAKSSAPLKRLNGDVREQALGPRKEKKKRGEKTRLVRFRDRMFFMSYRVGGAPSSNGCPRGLRPSPLHRASSF